MQDPRNLVTSYTPDAFGNRKVTASPDTASTNAVFDSENSLSSVTDARGKTTSISYDAINRLILVSYASGTPSRFEYNGGSNPVPSSAGKLTKITDESGTTVSSPSK